MEGDTHTQQQQLDFAQNFRCCCCWLLCLKRKVWLAVRAESSQCLILEVSHFCQFWFWMLDSIQVQDCKNKQIEQSQAFARSYYSWFLYGRIFWKYCGYKTNLPILKKFNGSTVSLPNLQVTYILSLNYFIWSLEIQPKFPPNPKNCINLKECWYLGRGHASRVRNNFLIITADNQIFLAYLK